jgi:5-methylcytosine-specific restriction endonuclease McrA
MMGLSLMIIRENGVLTYRDGREVCDLKTRAGRREYDLRKAKMYERDGGTCCICGEHIYHGSDVTFEHQDKRGMGGSRRDDRIENNGVAHSWCNMKLGSVRIK